MAFLPEARASKRRLVPLAGLFEFCNFNSLRKSGTQSPTGFQRRSNYLGIFTRSKHLIMFLSPNIVAVPAGTSGFHKQTSPRLEGIGFAVRDNNFPGGALKLSAAMRANVNH
jgi:hypothetical protein